MLAGKDWKDFQSCFFKDQDHFFCFLGTLQQFYDLDLDIRSFFKRDLDLILDQFCDDDLDLILNHF
jgi:hypothetical protein